MVAYVTSDGEGAILTIQQIDQLLKLLPSSSGANKGTSDTEEEVEIAFSGMVTCNNVVKYLDD